MNKSKPNNHLLLSIISFLFFWPLAIVAIINSSKVNSEYDKGNIEASYKASKRAKKFALIAIILPLILGLIISAIAFFVFDVRIHPFFTLIFVLGITILLISFIENKASKTMKKVVQLVLWLLIAFLGYQTYMSIYEPIQFNKVKNKRYAIVIESLKDIRDAQLAHKQVTGKFTDNFDNLIKFVDTAKFTLTQRRDSTVIDEVLTKQFGVDMTKEIVIVDTLGYVPVKDSLFKTSTRYKTMMNVPGTEGDKFNLKAGFIMQNDIRIPVFEAFVLKNTILADQNKDLLVQENQVVSVDGVNGDRLKVGSMEEVNTNGNWPKTYGTAE